MKSTECKAYVHITSLGCPKNLVDTELLTASLLDAGFGLAENTDAADISLISTCAFIQPAREEASEFISDAEKWKGAGNGRTIVVCGCLPQWDSDGSYQKRHPNVDLWFKPDEAADIGRKLGEFSEHKRIPKKSSPRTPQFLYDHRTPRLPLTPPHYAYLKIADGCNNRCSYCSIPRIRGALRSRTVNSVLREAEDLLENGAKELILIAQDTSAFGKDRGKPFAIIDLLQKLDAMPGDFWLRILYAHPGSISADHGYQRDFIAAFKNAKHLLPYLDLPLQHITDKMLKRMNRHITRRKIENLLREFNSEIPQLGLRTTFIVGHPGEDEQDFRELRRFIASQKFMRLGIFPYFIENQTAAACQSKHLDAEIANRRAQELNLIQNEISNSRNRQLAGRIIDGIIDLVHTEGAVARSIYDAPDIDQIIEITGHGDMLPGDFGKFRITRTTEHALQGIPA